MLTLRKPTVGRTEYGKCIRPIVGFLGCAEKVHHRLSNQPLARGIKITAAGSAGGWVARLSTQGGDAPLYAGRALGAA